MVDISIVICTYERPALLKALLQSIFDMNGIDQNNFELIVVDNSNTGSAQIAVESFSCNAPFPISYLTAHPPNISVARNAGCQASVGKAVAFLDDDQQVGPGWLMAVLDGLSRFPQDVFFGPITPSFEDSTAITPPARALFIRTTDQSAGSELFAFNRPATQSFVLSTANSVFRRASALPGAEPFDIDFGQCGGEDFHLFCRLQRAGRRFGWLPAADAGDFVPRHRCGGSYLVRRHFAGGQAFASALIRTSPHPTREGLVVSLKAVLQLMLLPISALRLLRQQAPGRSLAIHIAGILGKLFWRRLYPLYRVEERTRLAAQRSGTDRETAGL